jgi:hypothetical protein
MSETMVLILLAGACFFVKDVVACLNGMPSAIRDFYLLLRPFVLSMLLKSTNSTLRFICK